ncbi:MAG: LysR family transcriptional regulator [Pseudomonadota bacterium]
MLDIGDFRLLTAICEQGSITRAAEALFVSQPTLSKRLARLESQLDARLFHRSQAGLQATPLTRYLVDSAAPIHDRLGSIQRQVERIVACDAGEVHVGVGPIIEQVLLPDVLRVWTRRTGAVHTSIVTASSEVLLDGLHAGRFDVIAGPFGVDDAAQASQLHGESRLDLEGISSFELIREQTINVARAEHPIFAAAASDLFDYAYAAPPVQGSMAPAADPRGQRRGLSTDNYALLKPLLLDSDYICGGPRAVFRAELASGVLREIKDSPSMAWRSACLVRTEALATPLVSLFVDVISECRDRYLQGESGWPGAVHEAHNSDRAEGAL